MNKLLKIGLAEATMSKGNVNFIPIMLFVISLLAFIFALGGLEKHLQLKKAFNQEVQEWQQQNVMLWQMDKSCADQFKNTGEVRLIIQRVDLR